jgi:hypothetical protein
MKAATTAANENLDLIDLVGTLLPARRFDEPPRSSPKRRRVSQSLRPEFRSTKVADSPRVAQRPWRASMGCPAVKRSRKNNTR